jgi:uncharacterized protein YndB with AHSA1/START domain
MTANSFNMTTPTDREIVITRVFDAPRAQVFQALIDPQLIPHWWGPREGKMIVDRMEVRPGGAWRFVHRGPTGDETAFRGIYREITPPTKLVYTFEWEGMPGYISVETMTLTEDAGKTVMTDSLLFHTTEERDGMLQPDMEDGARTSMDRLDELLAKGESLMG